MAEHVTDEGLSRSDYSLISSTISDDHDSRSDTWSKVSTSPERSPASASNRPVSSKRGTSSSLLSRLLFNRPSEQDATADTSIVTSPQSTDEDDGSFPDLEPASTAGGDGGKMQIVKQRKRKGSLRKVALLGGRRLTGEIRERRNSLLQRGSKSSQLPDLPVQDLSKYRTAQGESGDSADSSSSPRPSHRVTGTDEAFGDTPAVTAARLSLLTADAGHPDTQAERQSTDSHAATLSSPSDPKSSNSYTSTTEDDDDGLSFSRPSTSGMSIVSSEASYPPPPLPKADATSYFPPPVKSIRPRSQHRVRPSPLQHALAPAPEPYSYAETEYWGWVILFVTWMSFTVGMGSCLDIWSWAWDVGETPYAPPELEDDPTLPIVGYYPALIVLTGVVAWVWITIAWIGMKYFRHAKIEV